MSYQDQNHDSLPEELEASDLVADFKAIYKANQDDLQSLSRIRTRLQNLPTMKMSRTTGPLSLNSRVLEDRKRVDRTSEQEKSAFHRTQRLNKGISLLLIASIVGAFALTFTWFHHASSTRSANHPAEIPQTNTQQSHQPFPGTNFVLANATTAWLPTSISLPGGGGEVNGPLLRTIDAGKTWQDVTPPQLGFELGYTLNALQDGKTAWLVKQDSQKGFFYQTHNGGQTWQTFSLPQGIFVNTMTFVDQEHGWFLGLRKVNKPELIFTTTNGGKTWQQLPTPALLSVPYQDIQIQFIDTQTGWLSTITQTGQQELLVTHTGGSSWNSLPLPENLKAKGISLNFKFFTAKHGYLTSISFQQNTGNTVASIYDTNDGGQTWQNQIFPQPALHQLINVVYLNDQQIIVQSEDTHKSANNTIVIYTKSNNRWVQSASHTLLDGQLIFASFVSGTTGLGIVDYSKNPFPSDLSKDQIGLVETTDSGATWTKVPLTFPTQKVTASTMTYLTYPGWTYYAAVEESGPHTFTPAELSVQLPHLSAKKWLVRFMCTAPTTDLALNGKHFSAHDCIDHPISTIVSFDTAQSVQALKVVTQKDAFWLATFEACTNEKACNTHLQ